MKVAVLGSRKLTVDDLGKYLPSDTDEIVSGGASGIDLCAKEYALKNGIKLTEFLPDYSRYKKGAPLKRNLQIVEHSDVIIAFWDGHSAGTAHVIEAAKKANRPTVVYVSNRNGKFPQDFIEFFVYP